MQVSKIIIASDHAGFKLKASIIEYLKQNNLEFIDLGCYSEETVDYPDYAYKLAKSIKENPLYKGVLVCGSGIGMSIAANRFKYIRAALCSNALMAQLSRQHNDANVLVLGERIIDKKVALECVHEFIQNEFKGMHHQARIDKLNNEGEL